MRSDMIKVGVDEGLISETLIDMYSKQGIIAEPAGAASIAALEVMKDDIKGKNNCLHHFWREQ